MGSKREIAIKVSKIKKMYKLGQIGGGTLQADLQSWWANVRGKEDPNTKIGANQRSNGKSFLALNGIDLTVYKGEALGIIGSNGAGKSTLLKLLSRITAPTEGEIDIYGRISSMLEVGTGFNGEMTGRENVYLNGAILGMTKAEIDSKMEQIIEFSEVAEFIDTPVKRYSSGMYVKLAFSVAAHLDSEIMIMDEVLAVGDVAFQKKCLAKMREAAEKEGRTVLYVSHNMDTIRRLCDRCIVLDNGRIVFDGNVEDAIEKYIGTIGTLHSKYNFKGLHKYGKKKFTINSVQFLNTDLPVFDIGDVVELRLNCYSESIWNNIHFRFQIKYQDGTTVGTMLSKKSFDFINNKEYNFNLSFDTKHLAPGRYIFDIVAYYPDKLGNGDFVDGVYPGFALQISDTINEHNPIFWQHKKFGHIHLDNIVINKV